MGKLAQSVVASARKRQSVAGINPARMMHARDNTRAGLDVRIQEMTASIDFTYSQMCVAVLKRRKDRAIMLASMLGDKRKDMLSLVHQRNKLLEQEPIPAPSPKPSTSTIKVTRKAKRYARFSDK